MGCEICDFANEHHHWPMQGTHCRTCHQSWTSEVQAHCTVCHEHFATDGVADRHWREPRGKEPIHLDPRTVVRKSGAHEGEQILTRDDDGMWHMANLTGWSWPQKNL